VFPEKSTDLPEVICQRSLTNFIHNVVSGTHTSTQSEIKLTTLDVIDTGYIHRYICTTTIQSL
jgi:hypothetical protein